MTSEVKPMDEDLPSMSREQLIAEVNEAAQCNSQAAGERSAPEYPS
jgi:hypothetical protein